MPDPKIAIVGIPSGYGALRDTTKLAPAFLRQNGVINFLKKKGLSAHDLGDISIPKNLAKHNNPPIRNYPSVRIVWNKIERFLKPVFERNLFPLILGGDCSVVVGTFSAMQKVHGKDACLLYFDGHTDNTPPNKKQCIGAAGMGPWLLTNRSQFWNGPGPEVQDPPGPGGTRGPLLSKKNIVSFGCHTLGKLKPTWPVFGLKKVQLLGVTRAAKEALKLFPPDAKILIHFDVDVICKRDMPAAYAPSEQGLTLNQAAKALEVFLSDPRVIALEVAEFDPTKDSLAIHAKKLAAVLVNCLVACFSVRGQNQ